MLHQVLPPHTHSHTHTLTVAIACLEHVLERKNRNLLLRKCSVHFDALVLLCLLLLSPSNFRCCHTLEPTPKHTHAHALSCVRVYFLNFPVPSMFVINLCKCRGPPQGTCTRPSNAIENLFDYTLPNGYIVYGKEVRPFIRTMRKRV